MERGRRRGTLFRIARRSSVFSFKWFMGFFLFLAFMAFIPPIFFHFKLQRTRQIHAKKCSWIKNPPFICAHGGESSKAPPNTMRAYHLAISSQVDCIEIDASRSHDGVLLALHDRDLQNMSGYHSLKVGDLNAREIKRMDAGFGYPEEFHNQEVPSLIDALKLVTASVKQIIIDAKVGPPQFLEGLASELLAAIHKSQCKNCIVWAKADSLVREVKRLSHNTMVGYIVMNDPASGIPSNLIRMMEADIIGIYHVLVDKRVIAKAHRAKKKVYAWTVDDRHSMERMLLEGVDGIITSQPRLLQQVMDEARVQCQDDNF